MIEDKQKRIFFSAAILLLLAFLIGHPLLTRAQVGGHSAYVDLIRSVVWHAQVEQGEFFPRWIPDFYFGHGSPIFLFYAPASYVLVELFRSIVDSPALAVKLAYLLLILLSLSGMFMLGKRFGGMWGGLAAAAVLGFAPYYLVDLYVRNGIAEFACFAILPWLFWALFKVLDEDDNRMLLAFSVLFALLVLTHNITAMITAPVLLGFVLALPGRRLPSVLAAYAGGLGLSAWFWLPALREKDLVQSAESLTGGYYQYGNHFVSPLQWINPGWGWGSSGPGSDDPMSFQIGLVILACVATSMGLFVRGRKRQEKQERRALILFGIVFLVALFFTTQASRLFWDRLPLLAFVQFPWRFLLLAAFSGAAASSFIPGFAAKTQGKSRYAPITAGIILLLAVSFSIPYVKARYLLHDMENNAIVFARNLSEYESMVQADHLVPPEEMLTLNNIRRIGATTTSQNDYLPVTVQESPGGWYYGFIVEPEAGQVTIYEKARNGNSFWFRYEAETPVTVRAETFYFPGWRARIRGKMLPIWPKPGNGWMLIDLPAGSNKVQVRFEDTPVRKTGKWLSLFTLLSLGVWLTIRDPRKERETE